jgi:3'-phosphoadenosine 5'-phosphosulfate sulfotransferase (PAPS reductase)/FAD synthetase
MKHIAKLSGGRDSTAMVFYMLENNIPLDHIIFSDTGQEFDQMYEYLAKVNDRLKNEYGKEITVLGHKRGDTFEDWVFGVLKRGKKKGFVRGLPHVIQKCYWQRESKSNPVDHWMKENEIGEHTLYIGYTHSEKKRAKANTATNQVYPLIDARMCEADVDALLERIDLVNPLYEYFYRTGCAMCPYQKIRGFYLLWLKFNDKWEWMKEIEHKLMAMEDNGTNVINSQWNIRYSLDELEASFKNGEILFDVEAPKACECGI